MSYMKVGGAVAAMATALALAGGASGDPGKSPNGAPGPAGNPNPPAAQPQANAPQGPAGNRGAGTTAKANRGKSTAAHGTTTASHGKSDAAHGKSLATHGKSDAAHGKSLATHGKSETHQAQSHANPSQTTPRKGGREDRPAGKITICHATKSVTNPYVEITISVNGLHGHAHHHADNNGTVTWDDIIPAPAGGCPPQPQYASMQQGSVQRQDATTTTTTTSTNAIARFRTATPEVATTAPAQEVLGERAAGGRNAPQSAVLGEQAAGAPKAALAAHPAAAASHGSLPFTGYELAFVLLVAAAALLGGFALRRAAGSARS